MLTLKTLSESCLEYIDVHFVPAATSGQKRAVANAINGALQELWSKGPAWFKRRELTAALHGPTSVTLMEVAHNSTALTGVMGWEDWMVGCTVRMAGDNYDNEFVSATELLHPYQGTPKVAGFGEIPIFSDTAATVFGDAITLGPTVGSVLGCVRLADIRELTPVASRSEFNRANAYHEGDYGERTLAVQAKRPMPGQPHSYWVDTIYSATDSATQPVIRLRVTPLPVASFVLKWDSEIVQPAVEVDNLGDDTVVFQLPNESAELILLAYVLQRFTAAPWFKNTDAKPEIARQFQEAKSALYAARPQVKRARKIRPII